MSVRRTLVLCSVLTGAACASVSRPAASTSPPPGDAQMAAIILAANDADIEYAQLAKATSRHPDVLEFARMTFEDHSGLNAAARALAAKLGLTPVVSETSLDIRDDAEAKREQLKRLTGTAFDSAYAAIEFAYHQRVWDLIEQSLLPAVRSAELKALIVQAQPAISMHKTHAMNLRAKFVQP